MDASWRRGRLRGEGRPSVGFPLAMGSAPDNRGHAGVLAVHLRRCAPPWSLAPCGTARAGRPEVYVSRGLCPVTASREALSQDCTSEAVPKLAYIPIVKVTVTLGTRFAPRPDVERYEETSRRMFEVRENMTSRTHLPRWRRRTTRGPAAVSWLTALTHIGEAGRDTRLRSLATL